MYELYRDFKDKNKGKVAWTQINRKLQGEAKPILDKVVIPVLEKNTFGIAIWAKSPFTNKKLVIHNDGKFETYNDE